MRTARISTYQAMSCASFVFALACASGCGLPFGNMDVGSSNVQAVTVSNTGPTNLVISQAASTGSEFSTIGLAAPLTISAGQSNRFVIRFAPTEAGNATGNISLFSNARYSPTLIALSGNGVASPPAISVNPLSLAFGDTPVGGSSTRTVTIGNPGGTELEIKQATISSQFRISGLTAPLIVSAGQSKTFSVTLLPATEGKLTGRIKLVGIAVNPLATIALAGRGIQTATKPPVISGVSASGITATSAVISWRTDKGSASELEYGTSISYGNSGLPDNSEVNSVTLRKLNANTQYHFRVTAQDPLGASSTSPDFTFTTLALPAALTSNLYGAPWNADGLANLEVGKWGQKVGYRFRAEKSGPVKSILVFVKANAAGYFGGAGGQLLVELQTDDGTQQHFPSGTILARSAVLGDLLPPSPFNRTLSFTTQPTLVRGTTYHLVFINPAVNSATNYVSIDDLYNRAGTPNMQPGYSDVDLAVLHSDASSPWSVDYFHTPILSLNFADGTSQGQGYIDTLLNSNPSFVGGNSEARETFTVTGSNKAISKVSVRLRRLGNPGNLTVLLETKDGSVVERGTISASMIGTTYAWVTYVFRTSHTLVPGMRYNLVLSAPQGDLYQIGLIEKGVLYGFNSPTVFGDGHYQTNSGSGWMDFQGRSDIDVQFFFTLADL